ncbi:MAG: transcription termination factor Rho [Lachnospiraceae bacterium]|nr:transcription termination factor Rho [Lachnospiraceae bacterium]
MKEKYETLSAAVLRDLAKSRGIARISRLKKEELVEVMLRQDVIDAEARKASSDEAEGSTASSENADAKKKASAGRTRADAQTDKMTSSAKNEAGPEDEAETNAPSKGRKTRAKTKTDAKSKTESSKKTAGKTAGRRKTKTDSEAAAGTAAKAEAVVEAESKAEAETKSIDNPASAAEGREDMGSKAASESAAAEEDQAGSADEAEAGETAEGRETAQKTRGQKQKRTARTRKPSEEGRTSARQSGRKASNEKTDHDKAEQPENEKNDRNRQKRRPERTSFSRRQKAETGQESQKRAETSLNRTKAEAAPKRRKVEEEEAPLQMHAHPYEGPSAAKDKEEVRTAEGQREEPQPVRHEENRAERHEENRPERHEESRAERQAARDEKAAEEISQYRDARSVTGILEVMQEGYGFLRGSNYMPGDNDVYVSPSQIRRFNMRTGDIITGKTRKNNPNDKYGALLFVDTMNGVNPDQASHRSKFEDMIPIFPNERIRLEYEGCSPAMRIVDLFSPIGKGQRGMIVSQPKAGKTTLLKEVAKSVKMSHPDMHIIVLLIDERPEEVTDMKESIEGGNVEVIYSTFDELPEHHKRVSEMTIERAKRLVEQGRDVMILLDSITRLARAYNLTVPPSGRTLSGGLDPAALHMPKRFFGAARNMREGGSLTILATALVNTGSKMDDVVYEEFKGTGNMELILDRKMSERRIFPAIDLSQSSTRRDDLLLSREERAAMDIVRRGLVNNLRRDEATEQVLNMLTHTRNNGDLVKLILRKRML